MKILHFGDLHVWSGRPLLSESYYPKRWLGPLNLWLRRARRFPPAYRAAALRAVLESDADAVLFTGDFTNFSLEREFRQAAEGFAPLREKWGARLVAIPGNHDVYTPRSVRRKLLERHLPWVRTEAAWRREWLPGLDLVGVNHSVPLRVRSNGVMTPAAEAALRAELEAARRADRRTVVMGHFAYATPPEHPETAEHRLIGEEKLAALFREHPPALYLHGHKHVRWALRPPVTPDTLCLNCGSVSMCSEDPRKQAGFLTFDLTEQGDVRHITAHVYDGRDAWIPGPVTVE